MCIIVLINMKVNDTDKFTEILSQQGPASSRPDDTSTENTEKLPNIILLTTNPVCAQYCESCT